MGDVAVYYLVFSMNHEVKSATSPLGAKEALSQVISDLDHLFEGAREGDIDRAVSVVSPISNIEFLRGLLKVELISLRRRAHNTASIQNGILMLSNKEDYSLFFRFVSNNEKIYQFSKGFDHALSGSASDRVLINCTNEIIKLSMYKIPADVDFQVFAKGVKLESGKPLNLPYGGACVIKAGVDVADMEFPAGAILLVLVAKPRYSIDWYFDGTTHASVSAVATRPSDGQIVSCLEMIKQLRLDDLWHLVNAHAQSPAHFVRWKAVDCMAAINPARAVGLLRDLSVNDPHPENKAAFMSTLSRIRSEKNV